ncbi:MAG: four helix bundle protein [Chloroflexi bacterium]|nr:MAG: four helix bundle protein [Chloroflexota bacterium]
METGEGFRDRSVQRSRSSFAADEKWNSTQQSKRAARSIPANFAEGHGRYYFLDNEKKKRWQVILSAKNQNLTCSTM